MKRITMIAALVFATAALQAQAVAPKIRVRSTTDRSILLLGQPVVYTLTLDLDPGVTIVADDLSGDALPLEGLELIDARVDRGDRRFVATYTLRTFDTGAAPRRVAPRIVRYAGSQPGSRDLASFELSIPEVEFVWRSVLPDELRTLDLKPISDPQPPSRRAFWVAAAGCGITGLVLLALLLTAGTRRSAHRTVTDASGIKARLLAEIDRLSARPRGTPEARRAFVDALESTIRQHVAEMIGTRALSLTSREMTAHAAGHIAHADELSAVVSHCEQLRFRPVGAIDEAQCRRAAAAARDWCEGV